MGATDIDFTISGKTSWSEVLKQFKEKQSHDESYYGHQDGYAGGWHQVDAPKDMLSKVFANIDEAYDWCSRNVEKRDSVAVSYKATPKLKEDATEKKLKEKFRNLDKKQAELIDQLTKAVVARVKKQQFSTCPHCKSRIATKFIKNSNCPLCFSSLLSATDGKRIETALDNAKKAQEQLQMYRESRIAKVKTETEILVFGVAPC